MIKVRLGERDKYTGSESSQAREMAIGTTWISLGFEFNTDSQEWEVMLQPFTDKPDDNS